MNFKNRGQILAPMQKRKVPGAASHFLTLEQLIWICSRVNEPRLSQAPKAKPPVCPGNSAIKALLSADMVAMQHPGCPVPSWGLRRGEAPSSGRI